MPVGPLSQTLLALHAAAFAAPPLGCRQALLVALRPHIPFDSAVWGTGSEQPPRVFSVDAVDFASDQLAAYAPWQQADRLRQAAAAAPGTAFRNEDLGPIADHWASDIHRLYCALRHQPKPRHRPARPEAQGGRARHALPLRP